LTRTLVTNGSWAGWVFSVVVGFVSDINSQQENVVVNLIEISNVRSLVRSRISLLFYE
jgi:hypothetical protein